MRTRSYLDGKPIWTDHGPGYGGSVKLGGWLVDSGPDAKTLALAAAAKNREKQRAERNRAKAK